jgi:hypothetical protein
MCVTSKRGDQVDNYNDKNEKNNSVKVFDWIKAARLIKEYHIQNASIGFDHSVKKTFTILKNGNPVKHDDDDMMPLLDEANPILIDDDRRETMDCFVVINNSDDIETIDIPSFDSEKKTILLRWPKEALDIIYKPYYRKDIQESKYFQILMLNPLLYFWPLLG